MSGSIGKVFRGQQIKMRYFQFCIISKMAAVARNPCVSWAFSFLISGSSHYLKAGSGKLSSCSYIQSGLQTTNCLGRQLAERNCWSVGETVTCTRVPSHPTPAPPRSPINFTCVDGRTQHSVPRGPARQALKPRNARLQVRPTPRIWKAVVDVSCRRQRVVTRKFSQRQR